YLAGGVTAMRTASNVHGSTDTAMKEQTHAGGTPAPWMDASTPSRHGPGGVAGERDILKDAADARRMVNYCGEAGATSLEAHQHPQANQNSGYARLPPNVMSMEAYFVGSGGTLLVGTDPTGGGGVIPGFSNQRGVELLVEAGLSPLEAIKASTMNGANYLGIG